MASEQPPQPVAAPSSPPGKFAAEAREARDKMKAEVITALKVPDVETPGSASPLCFRVVKRAYEPTAPKDNYAAGLRLAEYAPRILQIDPASRTLRMMRKNWGIVNAVRMKSIDSFELRRSCGFHEIAIAPAESGNASLIRCSWAGEDVEFYCTSRPEARLLRQLLVQCGCDEPMQVPRLIRGGCVDRCGRLLGGVNKVVSFFAGERKELETKMRYVEVRAPAGPGCSARLLVYKSELSGCAHNIFDLERCAVGVDGERFFSLIGEHGVLVSLIAKDRNERDGWVEAIEKCAA